jgi:uncharacterized protein (DUF302 family)
MLRARANLFATLSDTKRCSDGRWIDHRPQSVRLDTSDRLDAEIKARGMTLFSRIDHSGGAAQGGMPLRPTELFIFGNARGGTPLMLTSQAVGIDLPLKALVWEDDKGKTWVSYNQPTWITVRHGLDTTAAGIAAGLDAAIAAVVGKATGQQA